jgi:hypothetical protein
MFNEPIEVTLRVTQQLEAQNIPYLIGGSLASIVWGEYRATNDADVLADIQPQHVEPLVQALRDEFYIQADDIRDAIRLAQAGGSRVRPSFNALHLATSFKVDIFIFTGRPFERSELSRRIQEVVMIEPEEQRAYLATPEDMVLAKLEWYNSGNQASIGSGATF